MIRSRASLVSLSRVKAMRDVVFGERVGKRLLALGLYAHWFSCIPGQAGADHCCRKTFILVSRRTFLAESGKQTAVSINLLSHSSWTSCIRPFCDCYDVLNAVDTWGHFLAECVCIAQGSVDPDNVSWDYACALTSYRVTLKMRMLHTLFIDITADLYCKSGRLSDTMIPSRSRFLINTGTKMKFTSCCW